MVQWSEEAVSDGLDLMSERLSADTVAMRKRWMVVSCWAGAFSTMVPSPTAYRFWTRRGAQRLADRMTVAARDGRWYEVRQAESEPSGPEAPISTAR